jgi:hypothetical protein
MFEVIKRITLSLIVGLCIAGLSLHFAVGRPWRSGLEMAVIGTVSALVGYALGILLKVPAVP